MIYTSESVMMGHPDKVADQISDAILDAHLIQDPMARIACETMISANEVILRGQITSLAEINCEEVVRCTLSRIGYDPSFFTISVGFVQQSSALDYVLGDLNANDQTTVYGYACRDTLELMPKSIMVAHQIAKRVDEARLGGASWLCPDGKVQVSTDQSESIKSLVLSASHLDEIASEEVNFFLFQLINECVGESIENCYINPPNGRFSTFGPSVDTGLTGRKIAVDTYGGVGRMGGGAFSGKDPTKIDRSGAYMARYIARQIVESGITDRCEVQLTYIIGHEQPTICLAYHPFTGEHFDIEQFDCRPKSIIDQFDLRKINYCNLACYGHFGKPDLPWERGL